MIAEDHPFHFLSPLFRRENAIFSLSKYVYTPDILLDEREFLSLPSKDLTKDWIEETIASLRPDQELALHSIVRMNGRNWHIPMIDFSLEEMRPQVVFDRMSSYLPKALMLNMAVYSSGRSFHAYSTTLIGQKAWHDFMGRLLLINPRGKDNIVDTRWIGHRLIGGFGSLRWSSNSGYYAGLPSRVPFP